ncbi:MAG: hypothetical protein Q8J68_02315 [Methanolobus sp.]|uniref:hypothetical protein n=1 Tax=Methanolobus sp. TaxID=1874737 RepID=UPI0027321C78|nr:hypothetical protein [Methanolobus sp.]MDP2216109.1 hypothetical protein [Methanolobus sp.]
MKQVALRLGMLALLVCLCSLASAESFTDDDGVEWLEAGEYTLYWGEEVNASGYMIKAADFSPSKAFDTDSDYVMLTVLSDRSESWQTILAVNNSNIPDNYIFGDRLNITALSVVTGNNIPVPYTNITVFLSNVSQTPTVVIEKIDKTIIVEENRAKEVYIDERAHIEVKIRNLRVVPTAIQLVQEIPDGLVFDPDIDMDWNFTLAAGGQRSYKYSLKALRPGTYNFTGTQVLVSMDERIYRKTLNDTQLIVHGPYINLTKSHSAESVQVNDIIEIQVSAVNEGDRAAYVSVSDEIPLEAVLVGGSISSSKILHPSENITLTYSLRMDKAGSIVMPSAKASFTDPRDYKDIAYSRRYMLYVADEHGQGGYEQDGYYDKFPQASSFYDNINSEQPEIVQEDHGMFQIFYDLMDAVKKFISNLRQK